MGRLDLWPEPTQKGTPMPSDPIYDFDLDYTLWEEYLEWCEGGFVVRNKNQFPIAVSTTPSLKDFIIWKQMMGYFEGQVEDE